MSTSSEVTTEFHVKIGRRHIVMPGARRRNVVVRRLIAVRIEETLVSASPINHRSSPVPGEKRAPESGG